MTIGLLYKKKNGLYWIELAPASFSTFGKVNPSPPQIYIFWRGFPSPHFCQRSPPALRLTLFGRGVRRGVQNTNRL